VRDLGFWLQLAGIVLQLIGVAFSVYGFVRTFHEFAPVGEDIWDWLTVPVLAWVTRFLGEHGRHAVGTATVTGGGSVRARGRMQYPLLDASDLSAAVVELDRRVREQSDRLSDVRDRMADNDETTRAALQAMHGRLDREVAALETRDQRVAVGGIRPALFGLTLTAVGLSLIGLGLVLSGQAPTR
jgi:hypothetical protein